MASIVTITAATPKVEVKAGGCEGFGRGRYRRVLASDRGCRRTRARERHDRSGQSSLRLTPDDHGRSIHFSTTGIFVPLTRGRFHRGTRRWNRSPREQGRDSYPNPVEVSLANSCCGI